MTKPYILGIDPDWKSPGYAIVQGRNIVDVGTIILSDNPVIDIDEFVWNMRFDNENACVIPCVEVAINEKSVIFGSRMPGALINRGLALAKCQYIAGLFVASLYNCFGKCDTVLPSEWNPSKQKKHDVHNELYLQYPKLKEKRAKRANGVNDDAIDAVLIAFAGQRKYRTENK